MQTIVPKASVLTYFVLTFAVTWTCFISFLTIVPFESLPGTVLLYLGVFAPSLVAMALTYRAGGNDSVRTLLRAVARTSVGGKWYVFAILYMAAVKLVAAVVHSVFLDAWPRFGDTPLYILPGVIAISTPVQAGEEIG